MKEEQVILVDKDDNQLGFMAKLEAHEKGLLHRAFSVFLFNDKNELLLQKRALSKYHSPGLWTNTCCSHPRDGESITEAANRRLSEEMGIAAQLEQKFSFIYVAELDQGLTEHELDHVLMGNYNGHPHINPEEVADWKYIDIEELQMDVAQNTVNYTEWFKICLQKVLELQTKG